MMKYPLPILLLLTTILISLPSYSQALHDFDHGVNYEQTTLDNNQYQLIIRSDTYQHFSQQSVFLLRHSAQLCKGQPFSLKVLSGVQRFDAIPTTPRPFQPNLNVIISCEKAINKH